MLNALKKAFNRGNSIDRGFWKEYSRILNPNAQVPFYEISPQEFICSPSTGDVGVRSMLHEFEIAVLYGLAKDHWTGKGALIDLGPYNGLSTLALAAGAKKNRNWSGNSKVFSYDLWLRQGYEWFTSTELSVTTGSAFPDWLMLNKEHLDIISPCPGDFLALDWNGGDIEVLFIDLAKTWDLNHHVVSKMFHHLVPGQSVVVQQDWIHFNEYWTHITMAYFADRFEHIETVYGSSAVFKCIAPISREEASIRLADLPLGEKLRLIDCCIAHESPSAQQVIRTARAKCLLDNGELDAAAAELEHVNTARLSDDPATDFSGIAASNKAMVAEMIAAATA